MMKIIAVLIVLFLLLSWSNNDHVTLAIHKICVKPSSDASNSTTLLSECNELLEWSALLENISKYFTSYKSVSFSPGVYNLTTSLLIGNVRNLTITGANMVNSTPIICCEASKASALPLISISNSTFVSIKSINLQNCGANIQNFMRNKNFISRESAAILLYNVSSMLIANMDIQNIRGYGIVGINVVGKSVIMRVAIFSIPKRRSGKPDTATIGGLALLYFNNIARHNYMTVENVFVMNVSLHDIRSATSKVNGSTDVFNSSPIKIVFGQFNFSINVTILNINVSCVSLKSRPLVHIIYNSSVTNYVSIHNSSFTRNTVTNNSIIYIEILAMHDHNAQKPEAYFKLLYATLNSNRALAVCSVNQTNKNQ